MARVLVACECSGRVRDAFRKIGHDAWSCDLQPSDTASDYHIQGDVVDVIGRGWDLMIAHPPCTYLCVTGNRWFKEDYIKTHPTRPQDRLDAIEFFMLFANSTVPRVCVENPIGIMSTRFQKPSQIIQPYQFGHSASKATCLWLKNLPKLVSTCVVEPDLKPVGKHGKKVSHWYATSTSKQRSETFQGIADAMADQWGGLI